MKTRTDQELNDLSGKAIGMCIEIHKLLGPGLMESSYGACFAYELNAAGVPFQREVAVPVLYKGVKLDCGYRLDFLIANTLIVELKAVERILPLHHAQLLTYLKLIGLPIGLMINFNVPLLKDDIVRIRN